jgi:hypothetical protein
LTYPELGSSSAGWVIFDCCFLRHPLDRLVSLYNHFRRANSSDPFCFRAHRQGLREFMKHLLRDFPRNGERGAGDATRK